MINQTLKNMKTLISFLLISITISCSQKDEKFCECLAVSNQLNEKTNKGLNSILTKKDITEIQKLQKEKKDKCNNYEEISGEDALELKKSCKK